MNPDYILHDFDKNLALVLSDGYDMMDRTGVGCRYLPGILTNVDISKRVPVPTRRKTAWKSMLKEYLWFVSGSSNINDLNQMGSKVWDFWRDDKFTEANGFEPGSIGYGYGYNLRNFGGDIKTGTPGFDQLAYVVNELKTNPTSRRILFTFYRPDKASSADVKLPACHMTYQFIVTPNEHGEMKTLNCSVMARSTDAFVGALSTNLQGATFITHMLAAQCGMKPGKLSFFSGHFHIYHNHFDAVREYLSRETPNSPILTIKTRTDIFGYNADDFELDDYNPLPSIKVDIAV